MLQTERKGERDEERKRNSVTDREEGRGRRREKEK